MAYFKLMLMKPIHTTVNIDDINLESKYLLNTISEFYSQDEEYKNNKENLLNSKFSFCYTYNEKFSVHKHHQKELTFSMNEKILYNDTWIINPFVPSMMIGTKLCLEDKYHDQHLFTVKDISYEIKEANKIFNITCQDSFSYQMSRQSEGYEIVNNSGEEDFIGAKSIDWWIYFKIHRECYIPYVYLPLHVGLYEDKEGKIQTFVGGNILNNVKRIIKPIYDQEQYADYYETFPFSISGSNANAALISVAETLGLMLNVYEHQTNNQQQFRKYYWVEPDKKEQNNGLYYSPNLDIQNFSFSQGGDSLVTVLNVNGPTIEDEIVTLIPNITPFFLNFFMSDEWKTSEFYPGFFTEACQGSSYHLINAQDNDQGFKFKFSSGNTVPTIIDQENLLIPIELPQLKEKNEKNVDVFKKTLLSSFFDKVDFIGSELELRFNGAGNTDLFYPEFTDWSIAIKDSSDNKIYYVNNRSSSLNIKIFNLIKNNAQAYLSISGAANRGTVQINSADIYMRWFRDASDEDLKFAAIADQCPWLENKLINFEYFASHNLITHNDEKILNNKINNELRIINGQLMQYADQYYKALHSKTETVAKIINDLDTLGAEVEASIYSPYSKEGNVNDSNFESVYKTYNAIWIPQQEEVQTILNYDELMTEYFNKYFSAQQRFLRNIYNFRDYWNKPISFAGTGIYKNTITVTNLVGGEDNNIVLFNDLTWKKVDSGFNLIDENKKPQIKLYANSNSLKELEVVDLNNFKNFYLPTLKEGAWQKCKNTDKMHAGACYSEKTTVENNETYKQLLYTDIVERFLTLNGKNYYYRSEPYYRTVSDANWFKFNPQDNNPKDKWDEDEESEIKLKDIYSQKGLTFALTLSNYSKELSNDELDEWEAKIEISDEDNSPEVEKWKHLYKAYIEGFPVDKVYWYGISQQSSNLKTFDDENISYYDTWTKIAEKDENGNDLKDSNEEIIYQKEFFPVNYVTPKNYTNYFKRVATSEAGYICSYIALGGPVGGIVNYLIQRHRDGSLAQNGPCFKVLDNGSVGFKDRISFETGNRKYTDWIRPIYGTDKNSDKLINKYFELSKANEEDAKPNSYYKFWKWIAPTYSTLTHCSSNGAYPWWTKDGSVLGSNYMEEQSLFYKEKILKVLKRNDCLNDQDDYLMLIIDTSDINACLFNLKDKDGSTSEKIINTFKKTWIDENSYSLSAIIHYPIFNSCVSLKCSWEDKNYDSLENITAEANLTNCIENFLWEKDENTYVVFLQLQTYEEKEVSTAKNLKEVVNDYYIYDKTSHLPVNFYEIEGLVDGLYTQAKKDGNFKTVAEIYGTDITYDELEDKELYTQVDKEQDIYERVYTIDDYKTNSTKLYAYYQTADSYTETTFVKDVTTIKPYLFLCKRDDQKTVQQIIKLNGLKELPFSVVEKEDSTTKEKYWESENILSQEIEDENGITYKLKYKCTQTPIDTFEDITNGTFWYKYHEYDKEQPLLFEHAALIETQLTQYWTTAYVASQHIEYFIPEFWQRTGAQATNHFNQFLIHYNSSDNKAILLNDFIPEVSICFNPLINKSVLPRYQLSYVENVAEYLEKNTESIGIYSSISNNNFFSAYEVLQNNDAVLNAFSELGWKAEDLKNWQAEKIGEDEYGQTYYYVQGNSGKRRNKLPQELSKGFKPLTEYNGDYIMLLRYLYKYYQNRPMNLYNQLQREHNDIWRNIYQEYPGLLLEGNYTNDSATNSKDLLLLAKNAFRDLSNPERNYSLTFIDINALRGYDGQKLSIGDSMQLDVNEYVEEYGDLSQALSQFLFISDISYDLRKDSDISLTVNIIKYQDKLIQRLAKLIK